MIVGAGVVGLLGEAAGFCAELEAAAAWVTVLGVAAVDAAGVAPAGAGVLTLDAVAAFGTEVRSGVLGSTGALGGATDEAEGVAVVVAAAALPVAAPAADDAGAGLVLCGVVAAAVAVLDFAPAAALCALVGIEGLIGAGSTGFGSVVIGCNDVADPGGRGSAVVAGAVVAVAVAAEGPADLEGETFPFAPTAAVFETDAAEAGAGAGAGEGAGADVTLAAGAGVDAGLEPLAAEAPGVALPVAAVASFFWAATCCNLMRSFRCVTRYACSTCRACWAPRPSICASCPALRCPNTCGLRYSLPSWCTIGGVSSSDSIVPGAALGLSVADAVAEEGGVPMMSGIRMAGKEPGVPAAAAPAAAAVAALVAATPCGREAAGVVPPGTGAPAAAVPGTEAVGPAAAALAASSFCLARFARCCSASLESDMV